MNGELPASARFRSKASPVQPIPLILLTGFLGSGKTTLLRRLLSVPDWRDTAVLVNELGAVGLDQNLLWHAGGATVVLENGCICCSIRDDMTGTLEDLFWKRLQRQIPRFEKVVIETTGLADPGPIIDALLSHPLVAERYRLQAVWCTVDGRLGAEQLGRHFESAAQAASADLLLLTKSDIANEDEMQELEQRLRELNPLAEVQRTAAGEIPSATVERLTAVSAAERRKAMEGAASRHDGTVVATGGRSFLFHHRITSHAIHFGKAWHLEDFERVLRDVLSRYGDKVLRMKGIIRIAGEAGPVGVQVVQQQVFPFEQLPATHPGTTNFLVCITAGIEARQLAAHFQAARDP